jgi:hypothetical protein
MEDVNGDRDTAAGGTGAEGKVLAKAPSGEGEGALPGLQGATAATPKGQD